jgi:hypothetical protein
MAAFHNENSVVWAGPVTLVAQQLTLDGGKT